MTELKLKQLHYESKTWKRSLGFMMEENIHLKNMLIEILQNSAEEKILEKAEYFQSKFIKEDERISLVRDDLTLLDKLLVKELTEDGAIIAEINRKFNKLRNNLLVAEQQFSELKSEFSYFLLETCTSQN